jgi:hypothetical protein
MNIRNGFRVTLAELGLWGLVIPFLALVAVPTSAIAEEVSEDFCTLDKGRWCAVNLIGRRSLPGLAISVDNGTLRIAGTTSAEGINVAGIRTLRAFRASASAPFSVECTRAYHGGRATQAELGVMLWRSMTEFVYLREPLESLFKDWNHYQSWQIMLADGRRLSSPIQSTDVSDEDAFLVAHPQPPLDCRVNREPRRLRLVHDGKQVSVFLDGRKCAAVDVPWSGKFVVCVVAGAWRAAVPVEAGFAQLKIAGDPDGDLPDAPIDALWETDQPTYWRGDGQLRPEATAQVRAKHQGSQLAMVLRSGWPRETIRQFIDWSAEKGVNCVALDIPWRDVERRPGQFDFSRYDGIVNYAVNRGLFVQLKPWWIRRSYPDWISPDLEQSAIGPGQHLKLQELTFAHDGLNERIARFVGEVAGHYRGYPVTCYTPVGATAAELEYSYSDYRDGSRWAQTQFRLWLQRRYASIDALDRAWGTSHTHWDAVMPPDELKPPAGQPDLRAQVLDWFAYREWSIKQLVDRMAAAVKTADPDAVLAIQMGRILDGPKCPNRGTVGAFYWAGAADMFIADPQPKDGDLMGYIVDTIRTGGKRAGMELDAPARFEISLDHYTGNTRECWRHGGLWSSWANWAPGELEQPEIVKIARDSAAALAESHQVTQPQLAMYVSKWDLYCYHDGQRWREYRDAYRDLTDNGKQIIDVLSDDMLLANPKLLDRYARIEVPYADCIDQCVGKMLSAYPDQTKVHRPESYGKHLLDVTDERR